MTAFLKTPRSSRKSINVEAINDFRTFIKRLYAEAAAVDDMQTLNNMQTTHLFTFSLPLSRHLLLPPSSPPSGVG